MSKHELSLSKDYVPDWTVVDAVRELFQNALDQQTTVKDNQMFFDYDEETQTLRIGNKLSVLETKTLLLGSSTKRNDPNTIGQFGEGYKIATLVLTRLNKKLTFYNYGAREVWNPRFSKSKKYGCEILVFDVDKKYVWQKVPDNNLTITIEGITLEEYEDIVESNLHLQDVGEITTSEFGRILHEDRFQGKVFVNGLFVCEYRKYDNGYDFKPQYIKIDRDRKLADSFELEWLSSKMWGGVDSEKTVGLAKKGAADVNYIGSTWGISPSVSNRAYDDFIEEYGEGAVPVVDQKEYESIAKTRDYRPVFVSNAYSGMIKSSSKFEAPQPKVKKVRTVRSRLEEWKRNHNKVLSRRAKNKLQAIIDELTE